MPTGFLRAITVKIRDFSARYPGKRAGCLHPAAKCVKVGPDKNFERRSTAMKYDFTSIMDRHGKDAIAVDGLGTGFAGMSAAAVISPMLIAFLHMDAYQAIGIALASDVLASAVSAYTYGKNKNLDIKNGLVMMFTVMIFTFVASYLASFIPSTTMGGFSTFMTMLLGIKFIVKPVMTTKETMAATDPKKRIIQSIICGTVIGCICGFVGAGGGMMMLLILTSVLGYELKTAVGTSVFIMTFTALTGALSHFAIGGTPDLVVLILCIVSTLIFARVAAVLANKAPAKLLNQATGVILVILGAAIIAVQYVF